ncbi:MAG TPA: hypothetical protein VHB50_16955 [Bryobacteraceae bacterium]|nr:hypothetical protein [Bryobacteraceae bacterium]
MNTERLESLVQKVRSLQDAEARDAALGLVQAVMDLHAAGLDRVMEIVSSSETGGALLDQFADDPAISGILLLHDLHPRDLETRVRRALDQVSPRGRGASAEIVSIRDGVVRIRIEGGPAFEAAVGNAVTEAAPDALDVVIEAGGSQASNGFVPLTQLLVG